MQNVSYDTVNFVVDEFIIALRQLENISDFFSWDVPGINEYVGALYELTHKVLEQNAKNNLQTVIGRTYTLSRPHYEEISRPHYENFPRPFRALPKTPLELSVVTEEISAPQVAPYVNLTA